MSNLENDKIFEAVFEKAARLEIPEKEEDELEEDDLEAIASEIVALLKSYQCSRGASLGILGSIIGQGLCTCKDPENAFFQVMKYIDERLKDAIRMANEEKEKTTGEKK